MSDYGSPDKADDFAVLYKYSPLHNVQPPGASSRQYPAVILTTGALPACMTDLALPR